MKQVLTSKNTSINSKQLPRVYSSLNYGNIPDKTVIHDFGAGKYINHIWRKVEQEGKQYLPYDPYQTYPDISGRLYNLDIEMNKIVFVCSNVLNVIDSESVIASICRTAVSAIYDGFVFSVYEGDKSGVGKQTKPDCYQRNERISEYLKYFEKGRAQIYKGFIVSDKSLII